MKQQHKTTPPPGSLDSVERPLPPPEVRAASSILSCGRPHLGRRCAPGARQVQGQGKNARGAATETDGWLLSIPFAGLRLGGGQPAASPLGPQPRQRSHLQPGLCRPSGAWPAAARAGVRRAHSCHTICGTAGGPGPCALGKRPRCPRVGWRWRRRDAQCPCEGGRGLQGGGRGRHRSHSEAVHRGAGSGWGREVTQGPFPSTLGARLLCSQGARQQHFPT